MDSTANTVRKFVYSHYFSGGIRQAVGVLLPPFVLIGIFHLPVVGMAAAFGALCVSIIDQPGPHQHRLISMLGCMVLGGLTALVTALATAWTPALLLTVVGLTLVFGLFSALGNKAALVGFACLLLMTLTMHTVFTIHDALWHGAITLSGGLWYTAFSFTVSRLHYLHQEKQAVAVGLFALAKYVEAKAGFYDITRSLEDCYRDLIPKQSALAEKLQAARDLVLRILPSADDANTDPRRIRIGNIFVDTVDLQECMLATYTDYERLRHSLPDSDLLLFARDALNKLAQEIDRLGVALVEDRPPRRSTHIKAELRAMEYETLLLKNRGFATESPEAWIVVVQILRRLRTAARLVERMEAHVRATGMDEAPTLLLRADKSLRRLMSREDISFKRLATHLTFASPHLRYAIRLSIAVGAGLALARLLAWGASYAGIDIGRHGHWVVLTILVIMKPGFALSWQRNRRRLAGTLTGCALVAALLTSTNAPMALLVVMLIASVLSNSLVQLNYTASALFNTMFVLLAFHFLEPGSLMLVGERAVDAIIGSLVVVACSFILPSWESRSILSLARTAIDANRRFLDVACNPPGQPRNTPEPRVDVAWRVARRDAHASFANFAEAFYRMMQEPKSQRIAVSYLNDLLVQNHMLAAQTAALGPLMTVVGPNTMQPPQLQQLFITFDADLKAAQELLTTPAAGPPTPEAWQPAPQRSLSETLLSIARALESDLQPRLEQSAADDPEAQAFEIPHLTHQLRQISKSVQRITEDAYAAQADPSTIPELTDTRAEPVIVPQG